MQASNCDRCYRRKGRCDKRRPCGPCARAHVSCEYTEKLRQKGFTSEDLERVNTRLRQSESRNRILVDELEKLRTSIEQSNASLAETELSENATTSKEPNAVSEVSYLSINAAGERQPYLGSTSGVLFAGLVRSSVDLSVQRQSASSGSPTAMFEHNIQAPKSSPSNDRTMQDLPRRELASRLMTLYFEHDAIAFPIVHLSSLNDTLERIYREQEYYQCQATAHEAFVFNMVLAIATASAYKHDWQILPSAESHHGRAMKELDQVLAIGGLESLQAILLLCQYRQSSSVKDNSASMWHLVGVAGRICLELGLHRETTYPHSYSCDFNEIVLARYKQQEVARRCFWCFMAIDRVTSNILGRPLAVRDEDVDTLLPTDGNGNAIILPTISAAPTVSRISVFRSIIEYRLLCGRVLTTLHRQRAPSITTVEAFAVRDNLAKDLEQWRLQLQKLSLPDGTKCDNLRQSCFLSHTWFDVLYANAKLCIWRPCPLLADQSNDQNPLQKIYDSSIEAITAYSILHRSRKINYSWISLQSIFMAGLSFLFSVSRHLRAQRHHGLTARPLLERNPEAIDISRISRACSNVMVAIAEKWCALRHCHEVFDRLSDAVLTDALQMQTRQHVAGLPQERSRPVVAAEQMSAGMQLPETNEGRQPEDNSVSMVSNANVLGWNHQAQFCDLGSSGAVPDDPLAVDYEFLHCYDDLQSMYSHQTEDPVMHLSQDWLGDLGDMCDLFGRGTHFNAQSGMTE